MCMHCIIILKCSSVIAFFRTSPSLIESDSVLFFRVENIPNITWVDCHKVFCLPSPSVIRHYHLTSLWWWLKFPHVGGEKPPDKKNPQAQVFVFRCWLSNNYPSSHSCLGEGEENSRKGKVFLRMHEICKWSHCYCLNLNPLLFIRQFHRQHLLIIIASAARVQRLKGSWLSLGCTKQTSCQFWADVWKKKIFLSHFFIVVVVVAV